MSKYVIKIKSPDKSGLIYGITDELFQNKLNIINTDEFVDQVEKMFFFRATVEGEVDRAKLRTELEQRLDENAELTVKELPFKRKIVVLATKEHHCLADMLTRHYYDELNAEIQCVISNHAALKPLVDKYDIPYFHISTEGLEREEHEQKVSEEIANWDFDYIVLAKYMRIFTSGFTKQYPGQIINIHHSFLPAFIGANPYKQAYKRGVKMIGATAHFVNEHLDDGPIIDQAILRVNHEYTWRQMRSAGRNIERDVLIKALKLVFQEKVILHENKTVVFNK